MVLRTAACSSIALLALTLSAASPAGQQLQRIDDEGLKNAGTPGDDWLTYGLNQAETRFSPLKQIDTTNVRRLGLEWSYDIRSGGGGQEATPFVWDGTVYGITNWSVVFCVGARTGQ